VAIDIRTHAEEPCGRHRDDGHDDFQGRMADNFQVTAQASADGVVITA
jgi:uncharacterized protein